MSTFWSVWITGLTLITIGLIIWLLLSNTKTDKKPGESVGHNFDGIEELDNPMPRWYFHLFVGTIVFSVGYLIAFPGLGNYPGLLGWTQVGRYETEMAKADAQYAPIYAGYAAIPVEELYREPEAMRMAQRLFANECSQCHGSDARGAFGFPDLTNDDWLWGADPASIRQSITHGRAGIMTPFGAILNPRQVDAVVTHVQRLSGQSHNAALAEEGLTLFNMYCTACHGPEGKGVQALGAPNLTDNIWLYGAEPEWIRQAVVLGRSNQMPPQREILSEEKIHLLTAYVYGLSRR